MISISHLDHLVLTVADIQRTRDFYCGVLGFKAITFGQNRTALLFGRQKINLHLQGKEISPHARSPLAGSADLCFITHTPLEEVMAHLQAHSVIPETGIVERSGAMGKMLSLYVRDPDGNLIELSRYI
ncbi:catechol 2,3-dioxygenase-like lactoylglutathione lyase family enzyme [Mesocricetibacter intestinalis]|uniref:Catechol 2,3-dioxygenase-like lactoylglutathione lyase family enzyme n=1 Tax=Mesocricetibacter intestinalis TaxID=1521930 RepID=A0A4R6VBG2_9PAST|nr:VOC family protein [Mesocricetibacter intestinalis]TDQ59608.1 catechol 2,3-dioxygenase-like lactoylglutathione lyase family enzyme [Mesocricetibacter intestinalis]